MTVTGSFYQVDREEIEVPSELRDENIRRRLWQVSTELAGLDGEATGSDVEVGSVSRWESEVVDSPE